jgi:hypothetical protein
VAEEQRRTGGVSPYGDATKELQRIAEVMVKERLICTSCVRHWQENKARRCREWGHVRSKLEDRGALCMFFLEYSVMPKKRPIW